MTNETFWLSRGPGMQAEGPFFLTQIQSMFATGQVTAKSIVCPVGSKQWSSVADWVSTPQSYEDVVQEKIADQVCSCRKALNIMSVALLLLALIPFLGTLAIPLYSVYAVIALVLCIVMICKGWTNTGINNLIKAFILVPVGIFFCQAISIGIFSYSGKQGRDITTKSTIEAAEKP